MSQTTWTWDEGRRDYYYVTTDASGNYTYHFQSEQQQPRTPLLYTGKDDVQQRPDFIHGDPKNGLRERLDPSYWTRTGSEAYDFFRVGKVFAMLHVQAASANELAPISDNITVVKYGERAFSQIRRFVIVEVRRGFVYACPISTYSKRGTLKSGCIPSEHSVVHLSGTLPTMFEGEREYGLIKEPILVIPVDPSVTMDPCSRLNYAKSYLIETNVKVKDIGDVHPAYLSLLLQYYREENHFQDTVSHASYTNVQSYITPLPAHETSSAVGEEDLHDLKISDKEFEIVHNPRSFFKKGRVFMTPWPEPAGIAVKDQTGPSVSVVVRRFVVIRPQNGHCTCLPINTYEGQGTRKAGVIAKDHAAVVSYGEKPPEHPPGTLTKSPIFLKVENQSTGPVDPMSLINFVKVYTVEHNVKVRNIGRIVPESIHQMDEYFKESFKFGTDMQGQIPSYQAPILPNQSHSSQGYQQTYPSQGYQQTYPSQGYQQMY